MSVLAGKVAMVTGAAGGIGGAVVTAFMAEGARVFAVDRDVTGISPSVESFACDVTDAAQVEVPVSVGGDLATVLSMPVRTRAGGRSSAPTSRASFIAAGPRCAPC